ncbi:helix-turn-helix domain-containing protein [Nocardia huaxiensis]|uniref:Helix-turn-helix domain-containing protein n=1 Tax=Nocardia huaxiensis TaxID=2755382 RepID=A0A7D6Z3S5_9NOCA|nr:helix-turn-helix transcriptional regulator [Nocardia huaxiensis]QLY32166.1 helix-turn-helix domain-containing protein [Nocardia huaxiensis]
MVLDDNEFGQRLQRLRTQRGMTRPVLGDLAGRSAGWVKGLETGRLKMPRVPMLIRLAEILEVRDLTQLTGPQPLQRSAYGKAVHPALPKITEALASYPTEPSNEDADLSPRAIAARTQQAWALWHGAARQRSAIATVLPDLLRDTRVAVRQLDGTDRRKALVMLAQVYHLTQLYLSFQPPAALVLLSGDRAMTAAQDADNPYAMAAAAWYVNHVYRDAGEEHEARVELARQISGLLSPDKGGDDLAFWGVLRLAMALSYAKVGREGDALRYWDEADRAVKALGDNYVHPWLMFGRSMVDAYMITIQADLMHSGYAIRQAAKVDLSKMPSATRRSFHMAETARAHFMRDEALATVAMLTKANGESPDTLGFSLFAQTAVPDLVENGGATVRAEAERLASALGLDG